MYRHKESGRYPVSYFDLCAEFPNTSIPIQPQASDLDHLGYDEVAESEKPVFDPIMQRVTEGEPVRASGGWQITWVVSQLDTQTAVSGVTAAVQRRLDGFATARGYDSILSACTYATSTVPRFKSEGQCAVNLRDATWATLYQLMVDVQSGSKPMPSTYAEIESSLPELVWPE